MGKKERVEYKEFNVEELSRRREKSEQDLFKLRFRASAASIKNPMQIQKLRREIARLNTFITQRQGEKTK